MILLAIRTQIQSSPNMRTTLPFSRVLGVLFSTYTLLSDGARAAQVPGNTAEALLRTSVPFLQLGHHPGDLD